MSIIHNGSKITECQLLALSIFNACARDGISLEIKCIPRNFNHYAELLSRTINFECFFLLPNKTAALKEVMRRINLTSDKDQMSTGVIF